MCTYCKRSGHTEERCWNKHGRPSGENVFRQKRCYICNSTEHLIGSCPDKKYYGSAVTVMCTYCKRSGHIEERCWDKHGRPSGENDRPSRENVFRQKRCYICNSTEHLIRSCPDKKDYGSAAMELSDERRCACIKSHIASACISKILREGEVKVDEARIIDKKGQKYIVHNEVCQRPVTMCTCIKLPTSLGSVNGTSVKTLRDSSCSGIVVKANLVKPAQYTGRFKECLGSVNGTMSSVKRDEINKRGG